MLRRHRGHSNGRKPSVKYPSPILFALPEIGCNRRAAPSRSVSFPFPFCESGPAQTNQNNYASNYKTFVTRHLHFPARLLPLRPSRVLCCLVWFCLRIRDLSRKLCLQKFMFSLFTTPRGGPAANQQAHFSGMCLNFSSSSSPSPPAALRCIAPRFRREWFLVSSRVESGKRP